MMMMMMMMMTLILFGKTKDRVAVREGIEIETASETEDLT